MCVCVFVCVFHILVLSTPLLWCSIMLDGRSLLTKAWRWWWGAVCVCAVCLYVCGRCVCVCAVCVCVCGVFICLCVRCVCVEEGSPTGLGKSISNLILWQRSVLT